MSRRNCEWSLQYANFRGEFISFTPQNWEMGANSACLIDAAHTTFSKTTPFCLRGVFAPTADMARQVYLFLSLDRPISDTNRWRMPQQTKQCHAGCQRELFGRFRVVPMMEITLSVRQTFLWGMFQRHILKITKFEVLIIIPTFQKGFFFFLSVTCRTWCYFCMTFAPMHNTRVLVSPEVQIFIKWFIST